MVLALTLLLLPLGCHSAYVMAHVQNVSTHPISLIEVDYPSASFGKDVLQPSATYDYRFKVLGDGQTSVAWTDDHQSAHTSKGPSLREGDEGVLDVKIGSSAAEMIFTPAAAR